MSNPMFLDLKAFGSPCTQVQPQPFDPFTDLSFQDAEIGYSKLVFLF